MRIYAIGDIHGQLGQLERAHRLIRADRDRVQDESAPVVHVGDLCDRGPDTKGVIDFLISGIDRGENWIVLKGNHDWMMSEFLDGGLNGRWLSANIGGRATLASYGVDLHAHLDTANIHRAALETVPGAHRAFLRDLPLTYWQGDLFFCHAGIRPGVPLVDQREEDLLWIRDRFLYDPSDHGALIVHGHTPVEAVMHAGNHLNIDTGAGYGRTLVPVVIEGRDVWALTEAGRHAVTP